MLKLISFLSAVGVENRQLVTSYKFVLSQYKSQHVVRSTSSFTLLLRSPVFAINLTRGPRCGYTTEDTNDK